MDVMNLPKEYSSESRRRGRAESIGGNRAWVGDAMRRRWGSSPAEWAFLSRRGIERKSWDRGRRGRLPPFRQEVARGRRKGAHPSSSSSMKIARFTRPPYLGGIMDNVWSPSHIRQRALGSRRIISRIWMRRPSSRSSVLSTAVSFGIHSLKAIVSAGVLRGCWRFAMHVC